MEDAITEGPLVAVVDDQRDVRTTLVRGLTKHGFRVHPFAGGEDVLDALDYLAPDCILLDMRMPGLDGIETLEGIQKKRPGLPVLFFTSHGDIPLAVKAMQMGAADFVEKPGTFEQIAAKIRSALTAASRTGEAAYTVKQARDLLAKLTSREREVLALASEGLLNREIAERLNLSVRTVESHRHHAVQKIGDGRLINLVRLFQVIQAS